MCSNPISKIDEETGEEITFACRRCDECIATRRHNWVARAMAEKAMYKHALCVALTYDETTQENRDAAKIFAYHDVKLFMKRLRDAAWQNERRSAKRDKRDAVRPIIRFLCAGEQGSRDNRCHWHLILYSDCDLLKLGVISKFGRQVTDPDDIFTVGKEKLRRHWTLWGKGFVTFQKPDQGGMHYVLSYCLKDQFTGEKSLGTMREARSENFATGLFRMSKRPPIGHEWLVRKMVALAERGQVLPNTHLRVPDFHGYWRPNELPRERLLIGLLAINQQVRWRTGRNAPQWAPLLAHCKDSETDMELLNGPQMEESELSEVEQFEYELAARARQSGDDQRRREIVRRCAQTIPCRDCLHHCTPYQLERLGIRRVDPGDGGPWEYTSLPGRPDIWDRWHDREHRGDGLNSLCQKKGTAEYQRIFPASGRL